MKHLVLMSKAPRIGRVKSRLASDIGLVGAWAFHRRTLFETARKLKDPRWRCWLSVTPDQSAAHPRQWPRGWDTVPQGAGDLGQRMFWPMAALPPGPVVIVGSDIPTITAGHIAAAFEAHSPQHRVHIRQRHVQVVRPREIEHNRIQTGSSQLVGFLRTASDCGNADAAVAPAVCHAASQVAATCDQGGLCGSC